MHRSTLWFLPHESEIEEAAALLRDGDLECADKSFATATATEALSTILTNMETTSIESEPSQATLETTQILPIHLYSPKYDEREAEHRRFDSFTDSMRSTAAVPSSSFHLHYQTDLPMCDSLEKFLNLFGHSIRVLRLDLRGRATAEDFNMLRRALSPLKQLQELSLACYWRRWSSDPTHILPSDEYSDVKINEMPTLTQFEFEGAAKSVTAYHAPLLADILGAAPALEMLHLRNPRQSELQLVQDLCQPLRLTKLQFTFSDNMEGWSHLPGFLSSQSPTLHSLQITASDKESKIGGRLHLPRMENLAELSFHFYAQTMSKYLGFENGECVDNFPRLERFEYHGDGPMDTHSGVRPSHILELLAHHGLRQLNLRLNKSDSTKETLNMLPVLFPSVIKLKILLQTHSLDVVSNLWTLWPGLQSLTVDGIYAPDAQALWNTPDKPPQGNLDELLTGVPFSKHEILVREIAKIAGTSPEDIGSLPININLDRIRHCLQKYKIKPGVVDACCLEELKVEPRGVGNSSWYHSSVTHIGVLALAMEGARLKSVSLNTTGLGGCRSGVYVSEGALRILRFALPPNAKIEIH